MDKTGKWKTTASLLTRIFLSSRLTGQAPDVRRQSSLLSAILLVIILSGIVMVWPELIAPAGPEEGNPADTLTTLISITMLAAAYLMNRLGWYRVSAATTMIVMTAAIFIASYPSPSIEDVGMLYYLTIPILFSSILLPLGFNLLFDAFIVTGTIGFNLLLPWLGPDEVPIVTTIVLAGLSLLAAAHRNVLEQDRRAVLLASETRFRTLVNNAPEAVLLVEMPGGRIIEANRMAVAMLGLDRKNLLSLEYAELFFSGAHTAGPDRQPFTAAVKQAVRGETPSIEWWYTRPKSPPILCRVQFVSMPADAGQCVRISLTDITEHKRHENELKYLATHDSLTGLPNRNLFHDRVTTAIARSARSGMTFAVLFLDVDNFKRVNEAFDHLSGDTLLREMAARFRLVLRESDSVARLGGDEFAFLLENPGAVLTYDDIVTVLGRLLEEISRPMLVYEREISVTASLGVSIFPGDGKTTEALLQNADAALFHAKSRGKNTWAFYDVNMTIDALERLTLGRELRQAIERDELTLMYQPQVSLVTGAVPAVEVLLRWHHPGRGLLYPGVFLPAAEEAGLSSQLDLWVLRHACAQLRKWNDEGFTALKIAVNICEASLRNDDLGMFIEQVLAETGVRPESLELELSEDIVFLRLESIRDVFARLGRLGIRFAIDDFGAGFSTLRNLASLPLHTLKLDRSFAAGNIADERERAVVRGIVKIASELGLTTVGEGAETLQQMAGFGSCGIDLVQGFFYSYPVPAPECSRLLRNASGGVLPPEGPPAVPDRNGAPAYPQPERRRAVLP